MAQGNGFKDALERIRRDPSNIHVQYENEKRGTMTEEERLRAEVAKLNKWVNDLQSGMYINCVYCGFRYGPGDVTEGTMQMALTVHVKACPAHPLSHAIKLLQRARQVIEPGTYVDSTECLADIEKMLDSM